MGDSDSCGRRGASAGRIEGDMDTRSTDPVGVKALSVAEPVQPSQTFTELAAALEVPVSVARILLDDAMARIGTSAMSLTKAEIGRLGPNILWIVNRTLLVYAHQRAVVRERVEELLRDAAALSEA